MLQIECLIYPKHRQKFEEKSFRLYPYSTVASYFNHVQINSNNICLNIRRHLIKVNDIDAQCHVVCFLDTCLALTEENRTV